MKRFPILLLNLVRRVHPDCPASIPWDLVAPHEPQALRNHGQTLARLAARGGLDPIELRAVIEGRRYPFGIIVNEEMSAHVEWLKSLVREAAKVGEGEG